MSSRTSWWGCCTDLSSSSWGSRVSSVLCCHDYDGQSHTSVGAGLFVCVYVTGRVERGKVFGMYITEEWLPFWKFKMKYWDQRQKLVNWGLEHVHIPQEFGTVRLHRTQSKGDNIEFEGTEHTLMESLVLQCFVRTSLTNAHSIAKPCTLRWLLLLLLIDAFWKIEGVMAKYSTKMKLQGMWILSKFDEVTLMQNTVRHCSALSPLHYWNRDQTLVVTMWKDPVSI